MNLEEARRIIRISEEGYAGMLMNGNLVDRREYPEAIPLQENTMMNIPAPKEVSDEVS